MIHFGTAKIDKELDISKFLKGQMLFKVLIKAQFSKMERYLSRRQHKSFVLDRWTKDRSSDSDSSDFSSSSESASNGASENKIQNKSVVQNMLTGTEQHLEALSKGIYK